MISSLLVLLPALVPIHSFPLKNTNFVNIKLQNDIFQVLNGTRQTPENKQIHNARSYCKRGQGTGEVAKGTEYTKKRKQRTWFGISRKITYGILILSIRSDMVLNKQSTFNQAVKPLLSLTMRYITCPGLTTLLTYFYIIAFFRRMLIP